MAQKLELKIEWWSNDHYYLDNVTVLLTDEKIETIKKAQRMSEQNRDIEGIRVRIDEDCLACFGDYRLGYGFVQVGVGEGTGLYFIGTDHHNSQLQVETGEFFLNDVPEPTPTCKCTKCGGTNVQSKAWVKPNENDKFVDYISEEIEDSFCDDCDEHVNLDN